MPLYKLLHIDNIYPVHTNNLCMAPNNYIGSVLEVSELTIKQAIVTNEITQHYKKIFNNKVTYF